MPNISKYVFESTILLSAFLLAGIEFYRSDAPSAVASLTLFMASGSRVVPALVRAQQGIVNIKTNLAASEDTLKLISIVKLTEDVDRKWNLLNPEHRGFTPTVEIKNGNFTFASDTNFALKNINLSISSGEFVAFVGKSGAGKSTLIDLILGAKDFHSGEIHISNLNPQQAVMKWSGAIAYVPQSVKLIEASLRANLLLGFTSSEISDRNLAGVITSLGLEMLISSKTGLDTHISQFGNSLSGGQIQRIGIARALISNPRLLILDEATSALDAETESVVSQLLKTLHGDVTIIVVAHGKKCRLSVLDGKW
jgi:ATP-binding cassette subfamily C protein